MSYQTPQVQALWVELNVAVSENKEVPNKPFAPAESLQRSPNKMISDINKEKVGKPTVYDANDPIDTTSHFVP